LTEKNVSFILI